MTEPVDVLIQAGLLARLTTPTLGYPIAYPLVNFTPPSPAAPYLDARAIMRAVNQTVGLAFESSVIRRGIFQVDAVVPDDTEGEAPGLRLAALVAARFEIGTNLVVGAYRLQIDRKPTIAAAVKDAPWVRFPVSIRYLVIT